MKARPRVPLVIRNTAIKFFGLLTIEGGGERFEIFPKCVEQLELLVGGEAADVA